MVNSLQLFIILLRLYSALRSLKPSTTGRNISINPPFSFLVLKINNTASVTLLRPSPEVECDWIRCFDYAQLKLKDLYCILLTSFQADKTTNLRFFFKITMQRTFVLSHFPALPLYVSTSLDLTTKKTM